MFGKTKDGGLDDEIPKQNKKLLHDVEFVDRPRQGLGNPVHRHSPRQRRERAEYRECP